MSVAPSVQTRTSLCYIPKPVLKRLGNPPGLMFVFAEDDRITVHAWDRMESLFLCIIRTLSASAAHATAPGT